MDKPGGSTSQRGHPALTQPTMQALDVQVGDTLVLVVPPSIIDIPVQLFSLAYGRYEFEVAWISLAAKEGEGAIRLTLTNNHITKHFTIIPIERLEGYGFLGRDKYPVPYTLTQNLEVRLQMSFKLQKGQHA